MGSPLTDKPLDLAAQANIFYEAYTKSKSDTTIAKQPPRSAVKAIK